MAKRAKAPKGFYTASDVMRILDIRNSTLYHYVDIGKIKKVVPPDRQEGYYIKAEIDKMLRARELFILEYSSDPSNFEIASKDDIKEIYELSVNLFGMSGSTDYEKMLSWYEKNPYIYYVVKQEGIVTGYIGFLYLKEETTKHILAAKTPGRPSPIDTDVLPFMPNKTIDGLWVGLGVKPGLNTLQARQHGRHLISGAIETLENFAIQNMPVEKLYATSQTTDGVRLSKKLGFKEIVHPNEKLIRFELDLMKSNSPLLKEYQRLAKQAINNIK